MNSLLISRVFSEVSNLIFLLAASMCLIIVYTLLQITEPMSFYGMIEKGGVIALLLLGAWFLYREKTKIEDKLTELHTAQLSEKNTAIDQMRAEIKTIRAEKDLIIVSLQQEIDQKNAHIEKLIDKITNA